MECPCRSFFNLWDSLLLVAKALFELHVSVKREVIYPSVKVVLLFSNTHSNDKCYIEKKRSELIQKYIPAPL